MRFLIDHQWPGNVRELINVLRSASLMSRGTSIGLETLAAHPMFWSETEAEESQPPPSCTNEEVIPTLGEAERDLIERALQSCGGNKSQAARLLGITRSHLRYRMMLHGF